MVSVKKMQEARPDLPAHLTEEGVLQWELEMVLGVRNQLEQTGSRMEVLIKYKDIPKFDSTWEDFVTI